MINNSVFKLVLAAVSALGVATAATPTEAATMGKLDIFGTVQRNPANNPTSLTFGNAFGGMGDGLTVIATDDLSPAQGEYFNLPETLTLSTASGVKLLDYDFDDDFDFTLTQAMTLMPGSRFDFMSVGSFASDPNHLFNIKLTTQGPGGTQNAFSATVVERVPSPALLPGLIGMGVAAFRRKQNEAVEENA